MGVGRGDDRHPSPKKIIIYGPNSMSSTDSDHHLMMGTYTLVILMFSLTPRSWLHRLGLPSAWGTHVEQPLTPCAGLQFP